MKQKVLFAAVLMSLSILVLPVAFAVTSTQGTVGNGQATTGTGSTGTGAVDIVFTDPLNCPASKSNNNSPILCLVQRISANLIKIATAVVVVMVLIGAFQILFAAGNPEKLKTGGKTILYSAIGYAIVLLAGSIVFIIQQLITL